MADQATTRPVHPVLWGLYLGVSWTWCIGMFLPILLVRDYGLPGYLAFALPNIVGAGAMGWTLRAPGLSGRLVEKHARAMGAFSAVTIAFHLYFLLWLLSLIRGLGTAPAAAIPDWGVLVLGLAGLGAAVGLRRAVRRGDRPIALGSLLVWLVSIGVLVLLLVNGQPTPTGAGVLVETARSDELLWLAPVCLFGFALCPYLDLTFHHARQQTSPTGARVAFTLGFGVFFLAMIVLTLVYSGLFLHALGGGGGAPSIAAWALVAVLVHVLVQLVFTVIVHQHRIRATGNAAGALATLGLGAMAVVLGIFQGQLPGVGDMPAGEVIYRCFMAFYGLVFPAYVWIAMIPTRDGHSGLGGASGRRKGRTLAFATSVAAPMFWMGFIAGQELWLAPGLAIVLLSRLTLPRGAQAPSDASTSAAA